ncbi:MAG TPA: Ig-like domain repeat protein [Terracidiphilus sp.]|nr:Ig-like domain repeat protein [Terracidiphilus sp.]
MNRGFAGIIPRVNAEIHTRRHSRACNRMAAPPAMLLLVPIMIFGGALITVPGAQAQAIFNPEPVGTASGTQAVTVPISTSGTVSSVAVLTGGASGLDFAAGTGTSTCTGSLTAGTKCTAYVTFMPTAPGVRSGAVVVVGTAGTTTTVLGTAYISGSGTGSLGVIVPGNMTPVAGQVDTYLGSVGDGGPATQAVLYLPTGVALDGAGNMYIADSAHNRVRMVCASATSAVIQGTTCTGAGVISTIAGDGSSGNSGNGPASTSVLNQPNGVTVDGAGNVYIADTGNNEIREIVAATGQIVTVAGGATTVCAATTDSVGDGCPALQATLNNPLGVSLDTGGNLYVADTSNQRIREVPVSTGTIATVAGNGTGGYNGDNITAISAELNTPYGVAFDASGNMYIPDQGNDRVRMVCASATSAVISGTTCTGAGIIITVAGDGTQGFSGDSGPAASAELWAPSGVALDAAGDLYVADTQNQAIRKVNSYSGNISTLVRSGVGTVYYQNAFINTGLYAPTGIALDASGDVYIADALDMVIREVQSNFTALDYKTAVRQGSQSTQMPVTIEDDGNADLGITGITAGANAQVNNVTTTCVVSPPDLDTSRDCIIGAIFAPTATGNPLTGNIDVTSQTANSPLDIELVGDALAVNSTTTAITSTPDPSNYGQIVTFTVTVTTGSGTGSLTGTVTITDTSTNPVTTLASGLAVNSSGVATFQISTLAVGQHTIVAAYSGDSGHTSSTSTDNGVMPLIQSVDENTTTSLKSSVNPSAPGQNVTFTATVSISGGGGVTPDGTVTFMDGTTTLGTVPVTSGTAAYSTTTLAVGLNPITAVYSGDPTNDILGSTSKVLDQEVQGSSTVILTSSLNPSTFGTSVTFTAAVTSSSSSAPTGTVTFYDGTTKLGTGTLGGTPDEATYATAALAVGTHQISAVYSGDANNGTATSNTVAQVVNPTQTATTVTATPNPGIANEPVAITATVKETSGTATPTGTVTFTSGTTTLGTATLNNGTATVNPALAAGTYQVVATYSGDTNDGGSASAALTLTVNLAASTTALTVSPNPAVTGGTVTFTASVTSTGVAPTGTVTFLSGTTTLGTGTLKNGVATFSTATLAVGSYTITASYSGDGNNATSTSAAVSLSVTLIPTTTSLATSATTGANPQTILIAVVEGTTGPTPTGTVTFTDGGTVIGSAALDSSGVATLTPNLPTGNYLIVAGYGGDSLHSPSTSTPVSISGAPAGFSLTVSPATVSLKASENATLTVSLTSEGGFTDTIGLGCGSLPVGVTCLFSSNQVKLAANGTATAQLSIDTNNPIGGGATAMNHRPMNGGASLAGVFLPLSALFGWLFWRVRRRSLGALTLILIMALSAGALVATGCSGYSSSTAAAGTYVIQVTGTGTSSDVIHYQNVSLTITQ